MNGKDEQEVWRVFGSKKKHGLGRTAATGLVFDSELRRAAVQAAPPVARLGYTVGKRMASQQLDDAGQAFSHLARLLSSGGPQLAQQLGLAQPEPPPRRRLLVAVGGIALVAVTVVVATDPARRRRLQRLVVH
ncbi:MAG TPA: hypothetical protein VG321_00595 [Solirubrobacteraceae bacterium]|nr:hypothetical protein [Solirubrobacteraceae bacterium]